MIVQSWLCFENISTSGARMWKRMLSVYMLSLSFVSEENIEILVDLLEPSYIWKAA
jgi:hypothetical protein